MANLNLLSSEVREVLIEQIQGDENKRRKADALRKFEIYRERQARFIEEKLLGEFSQKTVASMRKITGINLVTRIVDEQASLYNTPPTRFFENADERELEQIEELYEYAKVNNRMRLANRYFKLFNQCIIQVIPRSGVIQVRPLPMHQVDVIPDPIDPEKPFAVIVNGFDKFMYLQHQSESLSTGSVSKFSESIDGTNQMIADPDDYESALRYEVWTNELNFVMDGKGNILSQSVENPIGRLPFIDIAEEKDFEFFVRRGNGVVDFGLEFGVLLSDTATINRLQGYSQAIVHSPEQPANMVVGPNHVLWLKQDVNNPAVQPKFEFATPSPDMNASLELLETYIRLFLTSKGIDPKTVSGKAETQRFSSGMERLLAMIQKFEASKSDIDLMANAELQLFDLMRAWSNALQGSDLLIPELQGGQLSDAIELYCKYSSPEMVQTQTELEDSLIKQMESGLVSRVEAISKLRGISIEAAREVQIEIDKDITRNGMTDASSESDQE